MHYHSPKGLSSLDDLALHSALAGENPAAKCLLAAAGLCAVLAVDRPLFSLLSLGYFAAVTLCCGKIAPPDYLCCLSVPAAFLLLGSLPLAIEVGSAPVGGVSCSIAGWSISTSFELIGRAGGVLLRALGSAAALFFLSLSAPMHQVIGVLERLPLPRVLTELMHLMYRDLFLLLRVFGQTKTAAASRRGFEGKAASLRTFAALAANLFLSAMQEASLSFAAMEARGYDGTLRLSMEEAPLSRRMIALCAGYGGVCLFYFFWEVLL